MGAKCIIKTCTNSSKRKENDDVILHRFPANAIMRERWILNIQTNANQFGVISERAVICSEHFEKSAYVQRPNSTRYLSKTAEPTLFRLPMGSPSNDFVDIAKLSPFPEHTPFSISNIQTGYCSPDNPLSLTSPEQNRTPFSITINEEIQAHGLHNTSYHSAASPVQVTSNSPSDDAQILTSPNNPDVEIPSLPVKVTRIRYPGDIVDLPSMSRRQLETCVQMCKRKVKAQSKTIKSLRRQVKAKDAQIATLQSLVKDPLR